jgi:hypothetical protein
MSERFEVPGVTPGQLPARPGYEIHIPGECLKPGSRLWTDEQRAGGIWLRMVYLTSSEEEEVILEAQRAGSMALANGIQIRRSVHEVADNAPERIEDGERAIVRPAPGPFKKIAALDRRAFWEELGGQGRTFVIYAFNQANTPSEAAREAATASFRVSG